MKADNEKVLTVYVPKKEAAEFKARCAVEGTSMTAKIREWITRHLKKQAA